VSLGTPNTMVRAVQKSRAAYALAEVGKRQRKARAYIEPMPLTRERRAMHYADQTGWTTDFTPRQRRRLDHKENRLKARPVLRGARPTHTAVDEVTA
jgi:hypothetical protein